MIVVILFILLIMVSMLVSCCFEYLLVVMEWEIIILFVLVMFCKNWDVINCEMVCEKMYFIVVSRNRIMVRSNGGCCLYLLFKGLKINCLVVKLIMLVVSFNCIIEDEVWKKFVIVGKVGKYMFIIKGLKVFNIFKNNNKNCLEFCLLVIVIFFD